MASPELPFVDEHETVVSAGADAVWSALLDSIERAFATRGAAAYSSAVGCADRRRSEDGPLREGSTIPGFRVATSVPPSELVLEGRHRFSTYALGFRLDDLGPGRTGLRAETRATFPGLAGRLYRLAVLGTGGHALGVRRLLAGVRQRAERPGPG